MKDSIVWVAVVLVLVALTCTFLQIKWMLVVCGCALMPVSIYEGHGKLKYTQFREPISMLFWLSDSLVYSSMCFALAAAPDHAVWTPARIVSSAFFTALLLIQVVRVYMDHKRLGLREDDSSLSVS